MFVTNWISPTKIQKISEITNFFRHYFLSRTEVEIYINWDNDGVTVKLSDEEAEKLLALWKEAQDTILHDVEEEDYWEKFDPWLQKKVPDLYEKIMKAFYEDLAERLCCDTCDGDGFVSFSRDMDGIYFDDSNEVFINQIFPPSE